MDQLVLHFLPFLGCRLAHSVAWPFLIQVPYHVISCDRSLYIVCAYLFAPDEDADLEFSDEEEGWQLAKSVAGHRAREERKARGQVPLTIVCFRCRFACMLVFVYIRTILTWFAQVACIFHCW